jgi:hypothetical protein
MTNPDFNLPTLATLYSTNYATIVANLQALCKMVYTDASNIPNEAIRWNSTAKRLEIYDSTTSSWGALSDYFNMVVASLKDQSATIEQINQICDPALNNPPIAGDGNTGRTLNRLFLRIEDATTASLVKAVVWKEWNNKPAATITADDLQLSVAKNGITWSQNSGYAHIRISSSALGETVVGGMGVDLHYNLCGSHLLATATQNSGDLLIILRIAPSGGTMSLGDLVDTGKIEMYVNFMTAG